MSWSRTFYDYSTFFSVVQSKFLYGNVYTSTPKIIIRFPISFPFETFSFKTPKDSSNTNTYVKVSSTGPYFKSTCV